MRLTLDVTAKSGTSTPTLTVAIQSRKNAAASWNTIGTYTPATDVGQQEDTWHGPVARLVRATWTVTGTTPSFTFSVTGEVA